MMLFISTDFFYTKWFFYSVGKEDRHGSSNIVETVVKELRKMGRLNTKVWFKVEQYEWKKLIRKFHIKIVKPCF